MSNYRESTTNKLLLRSWAVVETLTLLLGNLPLSDRVGVYLFMFLNYIVNFAVTTFKAYESLGVLGRDRKVSR